MALNPEDIVNHEFKQALRGYAVQEVDDLLDRLADQLERAERDIADLRQRVSDAEARTTEALATESSLKRTLITAQDAAQRTIDDAQIHADTVRADADREAGTRLDDAVARSTAMLEEAESEAVAIRSRCRSEQQASATRVVELAALEDRYRMQLRSLLEHELRDLDRLEATGAPGGREVAEVRDGLSALALDGPGDGRSDAAPGGARGSECPDGDREGVAGTDEVELVAFGGLTVRVRDDENGPVGQRDEDDRDDARGHVGDGHAGDERGVDDHVDADRDPTA